MSFEKDVFIKRRLISTMSLFVLSVLMAGGIGYFVSLRPEDSIFLVLLACFIIIFIIIMRNKRRALNAAVFCLPFTQVPTIKFFLRWRMTELISWFLMPANMANLFRRFRRMPLPVQIFFSSMVLYFLYTALISLATAPFLEVRIEKALEYTYHPLLRALLESARALATVSLIAGLINLATSWQDYEKILKVFVWGGAASGLYGLYQASVTQFALPLPLLPQTLTHQGYSRPFSTFYEPTGLGSYTAASTILGIRFLQQSNRGDLGRYFILLLLNSLGLLISLSRAGFAGFGIGIVILSLILLTRLKLGRWIFSTTLLVISLGPIYLFVRYLLLDIIDISVSRWYVEQSLAERLSVYEQLFHFLLKNPVGVGQGLFLFIGGGAPGFFRLIVEGGILGTIFLVGMHTSAFLSLIRLFRRKPKFIIDIAPFIAATYFCTLTTTLNYISTNDAWIWFVWSLPSITLTLRKRVGSL